MMVPRSDMYVNATKFLEEAKKLESQLNTAGIAAYIQPVYHVMVPREGYHPAMQIVREQRRQKRSAREQKRSDANASGS